MKIKICGLTREQDIEYLNEARPDYAGFVFAESKRKVSRTQAQNLRSRLADGITPVGVFVNAPIEEIAALYRDGTISIAQLHGEEDEGYIERLKSECGVPVIKTVIYEAEKKNKPQSTQSNTEEDTTSFLKNSVKLCDLCGEISDYFLFDAGAGSGKAFDWSTLVNLEINKPWFLAGGINLDNIRQAMALNPYAVDISSGAETDGYKDLEKVLLLTDITKNVCPLKLLGGVGG